MRNAIVDENSKLNIDFYTIQQFNTLEVYPPMLVKNIDEVVQKLEDKKNEFLEKRKQAIEKSDKGELVEEVDQKDNEK